MKTRAYISLLAAAALLAAWPCHFARAGGVGTTSSNFLKIPVAAIPSGMGEAYTAMAGPDSILYNPAGLGLLSYSAFTGAHNQYIEGIKQEYLALAWRFPFGTVGGAFTTLSSGEFNSYDENDMAVGKISTSHRTIAFSYARSWPNFKGDLRKLDPMLITPTWNNIEPVNSFRSKSCRLAAGVSVRSISETLAGESFSAYAFDAGLTAVLPHHFHVGVSALNFGGKQQFMQESYSLPSSLRFGLAKDLHTVNDVMIFTVATDLVKYSDRDYMSVVGLEADIKKVFQMRLGYRTQKDSGSRISGGFGLNLDRLSDKNSFMRGARVDYAYIDYGALGGTNRLGVQFIW